MQRGFVTCLDQHVDMIIHKTDSINQDSQLYSLDLYYGDENNGVFAGLKDYGPV